MDSGGVGSSPAAATTTTNCHPIGTISCKGIPVVDFSALIKGTLNQRLQIIRDIGQACDEWGCFSLVNHGVPESLRSSMVEALGEFFDLPVEDRGEFMGKKMLDPIKHEEGLVTTIEGVQFFRDFVRIFVHPTLHAPPKPLHFRAICEEYASQTREISIKLLNAIGESLGLEESYMENALDLANGHQLLVGNRYPPSQQQGSAFGLAPHSDTPLLSLVMQDGSIDGLQVLHDEKWVLVRLIPGSFFVHAGDLLEIVSNGRYQSLLHRVILNNKSTRISIVTALGTTTENVISPAPKLLEIANNKSMFRSIKYIDFVELTKQNQFWKAGLALIKS